MTKLYRALLIRGDDSSQIECKSLDELKRCVAAAHTANPIQACMLATLIDGEVLNTRPLGYTEVF